MTPKILSKNVLSKSAAIILHHLVDLPVLAIMHVHQALINCVLHAETRHERLVFLTDAKDTTECLLL